MADQDQDEEKEDASVPQAAVCEPSGSNEGGEGGEKDSVKEAAEGVETWTGRAEKYGVTPIADVMKGQAAAGEMGEQAAERTAASLGGEAAEEVEVDGFKKALAGADAESKAADLELVGNGLKGVGAVAGAVGGVINVVNGVEDIEKGDEAKGGMEVAAGGLGIGGAAVEGAQAVGLIGSAVEAQAAGMTTAAMAAGGDGIAVTAAELTAMGVTDVGATLGAGGAAYGSAAVVGPAAAALAGGIGTGIAMEEMTKSTGEFKDDSGNNEGAAEHYGERAGNFMESLVDGKNEDGTTKSLGQQSTLGTVAGVTGAAVGGAVGGLLGNIYGVAEWASQKAGIDKKPDEE